MDLGTRQIRTSGKGSGSIELTLPSDLRDLVGLPCRVLLRDGLRPEIALQPDLGRAVAGFTRVWQAMLAAILPDRADQPLQLGAFVLGLQPGMSGGDRPYLCWRDGLVLMGGPPHDRLVVARTVASFAQSLAATWAIAPGLAGEFGAACGLLATGQIPSPGSQQICDLVATSLPEARCPQAASILADPVGEGAAGAEFWQRATAPLCAAIDLFIGWTANPSDLATLRAAWQRGFSIELSGG